MALNEVALNNIKDTFAANWSPLTGSNGLDAWLRWFLREDTDEYLVHEALRRIVKQRIDDGKLDPRNDKPRLVELQAVYFKVKKEHDVREVVELQEQQDCTFCKNFGYLYIVVHTNAYTSGENMIKEIPQDPAHLRRFCYYYTIPCTCSRGASIMADKAESASKEGGFTKPINPDRLRNVLSTKAMYFEDANRLVHAYNKHRQQILHPKSQKELDQERINKDMMFKAFMKGAKTRISHMPSQKDI
jgi:hypothetical protein